MNPPNYPVLAKWAIPPSQKELDDLIDTLRLRHAATAFLNNFERLRSLANLAAVVTAHRSDVGILDGAAYVEDCATRKQIPSVQLGLERLYASVLSAAWTAFEVLAGDLWREVVNEYPVLGIRAVGAEILPNDDLDAQERKSKKPIQVIAREVLNPGFDLKKRLGDVLADAFPMTKFRLIRDAYKQIFRDNEVLEIISHKDMRALSAVRNALVHSNGIADDDFLIQIQGDTRFSTLTLKSQITPDGKLTTDLIASARSQGIALLKYVEQWHQREELRSSTSAHEKGSA